MKDHESGYNGPLNEMTDKLSNQEGIPNILSMSKIWQESGRSVSLKNPKVEDQSTFSSKSEHPGMDATQALENVILDQFNRQPGAQEKYEKWLEQNPEIGPNLENAFGLARTPEENALNWAISTVETALLTQKLSDSRKQGTEDTETREKCFNSLAKSEKLWRKIGVTENDRVTFNTKTKEAEVYTTKPRPETIIDRYLDSGDRIIPDDLLPFGLRLKIGSSAGVVAVTQLLTACGGAPVQAEVINVPAKATDVNVSIKTTPTQEAKPTSTSTTEPTAKPTTELTKTADGKFYPVPDAFVESTIGKLQSVEQLPVNSAFLPNIIIEAQNQLGMKSENINITGFNIIGEKGNSPYVLVSNMENGKFYAVFGIDENGFYLTAGSGAKTAFLPMTQIDKDGEIGFGFDVGGDLLLPPTFVYKDGKLTYTDPKTGEQVNVPIEGAGVHKVLALLTNPKSSLTIGEKTPTPEVKQFSICTPEQYANCLINVEDLFNGNYFNWLNTLSKPFDLSKINNVPLKYDISEIIYNDKTAPNFSTKDSEPFRRDVTAGYTEYQGRKYIVMPIEYFDTLHPDKNQWVITVHQLFNDTSDFTEADTQAMIKAWRDKSNITKINTHDKPVFSNSKDPLVSRTFTSIADIYERIRRFTNSVGKKNKLNVNGQDMTALSAPGIILLNEISSDPSNPQMYK